MYEVAWHGLNEKYLHFLNAVQYIEKPHTSQSDISVLTGKNWLVIKPIPAKNRLIIALTSIVLLIFVRPH